MLYIPSVCIVSLIIITFAVFLNDHSPNDLPTEVPVESEPILQDDIPESSTQYPLVYRASPDIQNNEYIIHKKVDGSNQTIRISGEGVSIVVDGEEIK